MMGTAALPGGEDISEMTVGRYARLSRHHSHLSVTRYFDADGDINAMEKTPGNTALLTYPWVHKGRFGDG
jgi:hypothetical protein